MALMRVEALALGAAGLLAIAMPAVLLRPAPRVVPESREGDHPILVPPAEPPYTHLFRRTLFGGAVPAAEEIPVPADAPRLIGIVGRIGSDAVAMMRGADGTGRSLAVGESVDGWRLESLAIDAAFFSRGNERLRVPLPAG